VARHELLKDAATSTRMKGIRQRDTKPEMLLRKLIWALGGRYRCHDRSLPGTPDLVNRRRGMTVFVHGCYWHGHLGCKRATVPKRNTEFWIEKIAANRRRDEAKIAALRALGFDVFVVWECEIDRVTKHGFDEAPPHLLRLLDRIGARRPSQGE